MIRRVLWRAGLAVAGAVTLTAVTALPGGAATTSEWRLSVYESSLTGAMTGVDAISRTDAWAIGVLYRGQSLVDSQHVLRWNGKTWVGVTIPGSSGYSSSAVSAAAANDVWVLGSDADGSDRIFRYDGTHWHTIATPEPAVDNLMAFSATDAWVTGQTSCTGTKCVTDVWQWNGSTWLAHPINSTVYSINASSAGNVWAVGLGDVNAKREGTVAAYRWAGTHWTPVVMAHPDMSGWPNIAMASASDVWIEGWRGLTSQVLALHWNGRAWSQVISPSADAASPDAIPYGSGGAWFGPWVAWTGSRWVSTLPNLPFQGGVINDIDPIPGAAGSYWGTASATTQPNSSVDHPAITIYGPLP